MIQGDAMTIKFKTIEAQAKSLDMCNFRFYKCVWFDENNNEMFKTMVEIQIDTTVGKQHVALMLTDEQMNLSLLNLFKELYDTAITQWQSS